MIEMLERLESEAGMDSILIQTAPYYGSERTKRMLLLFAAEVIPYFRKKAAYDHVGSRAVEAGPA